MSTNISHVFVDQVSWKGEVYHGFCPSVPEDLALALGLTGSSDKTPKPIQIDPNVATAEDFASIPNVSPKLAEAILAIKVKQPDSKYTSFSHLKDSVSPYVFFSDTDWAALGSHFSFETPAPTFAPPIPDSSSEGTGQAADTNSEEGSDSDDDDSDGEDSGEHSTPTSSGHRRRSPKTS